MKNALIVACVVVTALSMLMCEISPSSAIWRIVRAQQQQEALLVSHNALQIKHNEARWYLNFIHKSGRRTHGCFYNWYH